MVFEISGEIFSKISGQISQKKYIKSMLCPQVWWKWSLPAFLFPGKAFWGKALSDIFVLKSWIPKLCSVERRNTNSNKVTNTNTNLDFDQMKGEMVADQEFEISQSYGKVFTPRY